MSKVIVRAAVGSDNSRIAEIREAAATEAERYRGSRLVEPEGRQWTFRLVGGLDDHVWGALLCSSEDGICWSIDVVHVLEQARGVGIGDALVRECTAEVLRRGGKELVSNAQPGDRSLKNLFERHGMVARTIIVGRILSGQSSEANASQ